MNENTVNFRNVAGHFVVLVLQLIGAPAPIRNVYPNTRMVWQGDHLDILQDGTNSVLATYHRSLVLMAEEWGSVKPPAPPQLPQKLSDTGSHPTDVTRLMPAVKPAIPDPDSVLTPTQQQHQENVRTVTEGEKNGTVQQAAQRAERRGGERADNLRSVETSAAQRGRSGVRGNVAGETSPGGWEEDHAEEVMRDFLADSTSVTPKVSAWRAMVDYLKYRDPQDEDETPTTTIVLGRERSGTHRRSLALHRKSTARKYLDMLELKRYQRRAKQRTIKILSHPRVRASFLASVMWLASAPEYN